MVLGQRPVLTLCREHLALPVHELVSVSRAAVHKKDSTPALGAPDPVFL